MHILVATTGVLPPEPVADLCRRLLPAKPERLPQGTEPFERGQVTVMTVIRVPHTFLQEMGEDERRSFLHNRPWESETAEMIALRYLEERGRTAVEPILSGLADRGLEAKIEFVEGSDPVEAILDTAETLAADIVIMGATRPLFTEKSWKSVSARVMERSTCPLVLIPGLPASDEEVGQS